MRAGRGLEARPQPRVEGEAGGTRLGVWVLRDMRGLGFHFELFDVIPLRSQDGLAVAS
jgi:hypothetical protein